MSECKTYIPTPQIVDICGGEIKDAKCVIDENAYIDLGIEADSNQGDINQAVYNALQASKTTTDELQLQIDEIPTVNGSETIIESGDNVTVTGIGTILSPYIVNGQTSPFEKIDEGNGEGYVIRGRDSTFYGNIGLDAIDFSYSGSASPTMGSTGENSFTVGEENISSAYGATTFNYKNTNASVEGLIGGANNQSAGFVNHVLGTGNDVTGTNITVVGQAANVISESTASNNIGTSPVFVVGNGTIADASDYAVATRSNAFTVYKNGQIDIPKYGNGTITGTATYALQVDVDGKIIEGALGGSTPITIVNSTSLFSTGLAGSGSGSTATFSNFFGENAGYGATNALSSNFLGAYSGYTAINANYSNFIGESAGDTASGAYGSNFMGANAGNHATNAYNSNFFGIGAGDGSVNASNSNLFGYQVGKTFTGNNLGSNNIIIGTNISLPNATANSINLGGVLFGTGTYATTSGDPSIVPISGGRIGIGVVTPSAKLHIYSEAADTSGLRLERLTSTSPTSAGQAIGVDASGNVITVTSGGLPSYVETDDLNKSIWCNGLANNVSNITYGDNTLKSLTITNSTAFGSYALETATGNVVCGFGAYAAGANNGSGVMAFGNDALANNTGNDVGGFGYRALYNNTGSGSNGFGSQALRGNTAVGASAFGHQAGYANGGTDATLIGYEAGYSNKGNSDTAVGYQALYNVAIASSNLTALGYRAGYSAGAITFINSTAIGANTTFTRNNQVLLGGAGTVEVLTPGQYNIAAMHTAPSSSSDTGRLGEIRITATHIYVCTATNTWVRTALATW